MTEHERLLKSFRGATPCSMSWAAMEGDDRVRYCKQCQRNVYNIANLNSAELETLFEWSENGDAGVALFCRSDGMVMTEDCPVGRWATWHRRVCVLAAVMAALTMGSALLLAVVVTEARGDGYYDQEIVVRSDKSITRVQCSACTLDDETRRLAEETADPRLFVWEEVTQLAPNRFQSRISFSSRSGAFRGTQYFHYKHLAVLVEFADGTRGCRVVDLPPGFGTKAVIVDLR
ncbi:MAG TPA: hypothetical protein VGZ47_12645 [Gemmataceae bacterium]|nr:hypothetical protein [Gemmataceae bacterium]